MPRIKVESRADYELFVRTNVTTKLKNRSEEVVAVIAKLSMEAFDNGVLFAQGRLVVEVRA